MKKITYSIIIMSALTLFSGCGESSNSIDSTQTPSTTQTSTSLAPSLHVSPAVDKISLSWNKVDAEQGYILNWSVDNSALDNTINIPTATTSYIHENLQADTTYYYRLTAKLKDELLGTPSEVMAVKTGSSAQFVQSDVGI